MKFLNIRLNVKNILFYFTILISIIWYLIFGLNLSLEPYVWDDLHFFREYSKEELKEIWIDNWDSDGIETPSYRPLQFYTIIFYIYFLENTFLLRIL